MESSENRGKLCLASTARIRQLLMSAADLQKGLNEQTSLCNTICSDAAAATAAAASADVSRLVESDENQQLLSLSKVKGSSGSSGCLNSCCLESMAFSCFTKSNDGDPIPYQLVKSAVHFLRNGAIAQDKVRREGSKQEHRESEHEDGVETGPWLHEVLLGSYLVYPSKPERKRSPELEARLAMLRVQLEQKQYNELVKDVTHVERKEQERVFMSSYKDQLGFGIHVALLMATGYLGGHMVMMSQFRHNPSMHVVGGIVGLIIGMMVEMCLFIIRASREEEWEEEKTKKNESKKKKGFMSSKELQDRIHSDTMNVVQDVLMPDSLLVTSPSSSVALNVKRRKSAKVIIGK